MNLGNICSHLSFNSIPGTVFYCQASSMTHVFAAGNVFISLFIKNRVIVYPSYKLDLNDVQNAIQKYKCSSVAGMTKIIYNLAQVSINKKYDLSSLKYVQIGGESLNEKVIENIKNNLNIIVLLVFYSMTEFVGFAHTEFNFALSDSIKKTLNIYKNFTPFIEYKIVSPNTLEIVPFKEDGLIFVRSYGALREYWKDEENTRKNIDSNRWLYNIMFHIFI